MASKSKTTMKAKTSAALATALHGMKRAILGLYGGARR